MRKYNKWHGSGSFSLHAHTVTVEPGWWVRTKVISGMSGGFTPHAHSRPRLVGAKVIGGMVVEALLLMRISPQNIGAPLLVGSPTEQAH